MILPQHLSLISVAYRNLSTMSNNIDQKFIESTIELAKTIQGERKKSESNPFADRMGPILDSPDSKHFLIRMMDVAFRSHNFDRISAYVMRLFNSTDAHKPLFSGSERIMVRLYRMIGYKLPSVSVPLMLDQIQEVTSPVVFFSGSEKFKKHAEKRTKYGITLNINPVGEMLIGENEAKDRLQKYLKILRQPEVNYISVKLSTLHSQLISIAHDQVIEECVERLTVLYNEVLKIKEETGVLKFINLDMEEYRDLSITLETFKKTLEKPQFKNLRAGVVLQAYLPDTFNEAMQLQEWAVERVKNGGSPIKVRLVKGANLEMEKTEASMHHWDVASYTNKIDTDANFKKIILNLFHPEKVKALNVGVASHNIFDLALTLNLVNQNKLKDFVDFEMLEGMAKQTVIEINKQGGNVILYTPVVDKDSYISAIAYLVRRLDEGTQDGNFLKEGFNLNINSKQWGLLETQFLDALKHVDTVKTTQNRTQDRNNEKFEIQRAFQNVADTDWTLKKNRIWLSQIKNKWQDYSPISKIPVVAPNENPTRILQKQSNWERIIPWDYELAIQDDYETMIYASSDWYEKSGAERAQLLKKSAVIMAERRADLIGVAVAELGKLPAEVDVEVSEAIDFANYYAESILNIENDGVVYENKGINLVLSPWNFPVAIPIGGVFASLAAGKRVILKPSQNAAACSYLIGKCLWDAGIPKDAFAFLPTKESNLDKYLSSGNVFDAVILTGGTATAEFLLKRNPYLNLFAETGGKNATIVTALADREQAIKNAVQSAFGNTGQKCSATSLLILERELFNEPGFKALLKDAAESLTHGKPWDPQTQVGPLAVEANERVLHILEHTDDKDWLLKPVLKDKYILSPGIKWGVTVDNYEYKNEIFAPILSVMCANGLQDAIDIVNGTSYGLTSGIESLAREEIRYWQKHIEAGNLYANRSTTGAIVQRQPFGGIKASSYGFGMKAGGQNYLKQFLRAKPQEISIDKIETDYTKQYIEHFKKDIDYSKVRGQHNICSYIAPQKVVLLLDEASTERSIEIIKKTCEIIGVELKIYTENKNLKVGDFEIEHLSSFNRIFKDFKKGTVIRSLAIKLPNLFMNECHSKNVHVYSGAPHPSGKMELIKYFKEQSTSINYHRYGNLMGESAIE